MEILFIVIALMLVFGLNFKDKSSKKRNVGGDLGDFFDFDVFKTPDSEQENDQEIPQYKAEVAVKASVASTANMIEKEGYEEINEKYKNFDFSRFENTEQLTKEQPLMLEVLEEESQQKIEFDLRSAVIYSEILKPKYQS